MSVLSSDEPFAHSYQDAPFTCASYNPFEVIHLDHIGPLKVDDKRRSRGGSNYYPLRMCLLMRRHRVCFSTLAGLALLQPFIPTDEGPSTTAFHKDGKVE